MIDIRLIREDPERVKRSLELRGDLDKLRMVDELLFYDEKRRKLVREIDNLRHSRNVLTAEVAKIKAKGGNPAGKLNEAKAILERIKLLEAQLKECEEKISYIHPRLPNLIHESVPVGKDESENVVVKTWGEKPKFNFKPKDHIELGLNLKLMDVERGAKVSGARFAYLLNDAVLLEFSIVRFVLDLALKKGFIPVVPPVLVKERAMFGAGFLPLGEEDVYRIRGEDLCLVGTSEVSLAAMHMDEILDENELPLRYIGFSTCFRTEAGAHGRDTKGIFRVHQFDKLEFFVFSVPEDSWNEHERLISTVEEIYRRLKLHYRIVNVCSGELGVTAAKKYDLEVWLPGQNKYREVVSCSNCTDYQARRLNIRCRKHPGEKPRFVHTLNSTAAAIGRVLIAIFENYQREDGSIEVPEALVPYMGKKLIGPP